VTATRPIREHLRGAHCDVALSATVFKVELAVSDVDHGYYADHSLTLARHPSETDQRMVVRLLAFGLRAHRLADVDGELTFGAGLSTPGEPDLRLADYTGRILEWIDVGQPDERALGKAASQADRIRLFPYAAGVATWWRTVGPRVAGLRNLSVVRIPYEPVQQLAQTVDRRVAAQVMVIEGQVTMTVGDVDVTFALEPLVSQ
jgi:uncharacterized protein YaeQ